MANEASHYRLEGIALLYKKGGWFRCLKIFVENFLQENLKDVGKGPVKSIQYVASLLINIYFIDLLLRDRLGIVEVELCLINHL